MRGRRRGRDGEHDRAEEIGMSTRRDERDEEIGMRGKSDMHEKGWRY